MSKSLLAQLREMTTVVADTGDIEAIEKAKRRTRRQTRRCYRRGADAAVSAIVDDVLQTAKKSLR